MDISKYRDNIELSDVSILVGDHEYKLHKFPLSINCEYFKEHCKNNSAIALKKFPGDYKYFEFLADHCYGKEVDINEKNVVELLCGAEFLGMHGKHNMIEKCQKVIERIFRSVEYSKSIEMIIPFLESIKQCDNSTVQALSDRGLKVIVDLWLRQVSNKSNFKDKYFEDTLVFEELLKLNSGWVESIIKYCSNDENKFHYIGKLGVEYIKINVIRKYEDSLSNQSKDCQDDNESFKINSSSCSSINDAENSDGDSSGFEKEGSKTEKTVSNKKDIGELLDKIIFSLPNNISLGKIISVSWLRDCLNVCNKYKCKSKNKLLRLCGGILVEIPIDEIKTLDPQQVTEMIDQILKDENVDKGLMKWIWDNNFFEMAKNDELDPSVFSKVVRNMPDSKDVDPDVVFQIVLSIIKKIDGENRDYENDLIDCVKLDKISPENLDVALESKIWKAEDVCKVAIQRLKEHEKEKEETKKLEHPYSLPYGTCDWFPSRQRYRSRHSPDWKYQSCTNNLDFFPHGDENYVSKPFELTHSYHPPYRQFHSTYCPDSYLAMEENLRCELKKISDSYMNYYKDRSPLRSRRRYQYSVPYDV